MQGLATPQEMADYLKVKVGTLDVWAHRRKGPPWIKVEGVRRYDWEQVKAWLEERTVRHG